MSDVPLGAFLSGGLDSSMVVSIMAELSDKPVKTFTIGFEESGFSEIDDARNVASHLGTDHNEIIVRPSALEILPDLVWYLDEPFGDSSALPTYYVCKAAREFVTVALSGDGGDESFAGYTRYLEIGGYRKMERVPAWIRNCIIRPAAACLPFTWPGWNYLHALGRWKDGDLPHSLGVYPYIREKLYTGEFQEVARNGDPFQTSSDILGRSGHLDPVSRYQYLDTLHYLPFDILTKVDRMSMANSLEVRSPLLDYRLVEFMASMPVSYKIRDGISKHLLRKLAQRRLPPAVMVKRKQGFAIPKGLWFQKDLWSFAQEILLDRRTIQRGFFREKNLRRMLQHHATGKRDYSTVIWCLLVLETWLRQFIDHAPIGKSHVR
jgi:asparagine synthase (glutamine-hydrolysing)